MARRSMQGLQTVKTEGGILSSSVLQKIAAQDFEHLTPGSYHLGEGETLKEAIARSWSRLQGVWRGFRRLAEEAGEGDSTLTSLTREKWLLPLFQELGYGRLATSRAQSVDGRDYPISHLWRNVPIHLVGVRLSLDTRTPGVAGAAKSSPHSLVQEYLNVSSNHLWGLVSNGLLLRLLRDHASLTRQAYVEFDLEAMFDGDAYPDFAVLWLVAHQSRLEGERPESFLIEQWSQQGAVLGVRALDHLREGVQNAIVELGTGFLAAPGNRSLRDALSSGALDKQDYYRELLRLVYRLIFLFVAEERGLLHTPGSSPDARSRYRDWYSTRRLREMARTIRGSRHSDLWKQLQHVCGLLDERGSEHLGLPALGSFLWSPSACPHLSESDIANGYLLEALRKLAFVQDGGTLMPVDWRNLGAEELGSVYESLLELHPVVHGGAARFELQTAAGNDRKTSGSYYTPTSLIQSLLRTALDPVIERAAKSREPEKALLALTVCDPACGSGHFLVAAAHAIARRLASVRTQEVEPSPGPYQTALRDVIGHCIYGVDRNPMAVELCKVSLWMEALEPGRPLSFLDHRIRCGNSLLGTTPALIAGGIPDEAMDPIEGDDPAIVRELKAQNRDARRGQRDMFVQLAAETGPAYGELGRSIDDLDNIDDSEVDGVRRKERRLAEIESSATFRDAVLVANAWCAAFVWRKTHGAPPAITHDVFQRLTRDPALVTGAIVAEVARLAEVYRFLHWHLAFPDVFRAPKRATAENPATGWDGGFDVVLGNPPWERIKLQEQEWFAERSPVIAQAPNAAARRRLIEALPTTEPTLHAAFCEAARQAEGESALVRNSGRYPLCGRGDVNTYSIFAESMRTILSPTGRVGCIVPSGIATDDTTKVFFQDLMDHRSLVSFYDFENREGIFEGIDRRIKFALLTTTGLAAPVVGGADFVFFALKVADLNDPDRRFSLTPEDIALLNPNTRTCPVFRSLRDARITKEIYRRVPVLIREGPPEVNPWGMSFKAMLHMANDSGSFRTRVELERDGGRLQGNVFVRGGERYVPLYEAKMIHHFNHRYGDYADQPADSKNTSLPDVPVERLANPDYEPLPRYWVPEAEVNARLADCWPHPFLLGWRDICRSTDERTLIASLIPRVGVGHTTPLMLPKVDARDMACLLGALSSFACDYVARQKIGGTHLTYGFFEQLPVLPPATFAAPCPWSGRESCQSWLVPRILRLVYTTHELSGFALECGHHEPPVHWDEVNRFQVRCELDAAFFHLYGIAREDVDYILETFPIVRRDDERSHGEFRTKARILAEYDALARRTPPTPVGARA